MPENLILVVNCGSSSLKFALYVNQTEDRLPKRQTELLIEGLAESLNQPQASVSVKTNAHKEAFDLNLRSKDKASHAQALEFILTLLDERFSLRSNLTGVGHRVVHGGKVFSESTVISDQVLDQIKACTPLAPLHNPANIIGIETLQRLYPKIPQVAVFDTAFHQTMPEAAYTYAVPHSLYINDNVRRYGFHGTSHHYITQTTATMLDIPLNEINLITAHLGNGASVCAIKNGKSVDTSMGMTPLEGLVMGTRCGDLDPGIFDFLISKNHTPTEISHMLNKESGLLGISGLSNDMRTICEHAEAGHESCQLALDVFCFRAAKHIAGMMTSLDSLDALIFTGGIGENASVVRAQIVEHLHIFGFSIDFEKNTATSEADGYYIQQADSHTILVVPTDEEAMIVQDTLQLI
jgi:acetate kinase